MSLKESCIGAGASDLGSMQRRVIAAVNRNDTAWLLWALGIPENVPRAELVTIVRQVLEADRGKAIDVLQASTIERLIDPARDRSTMASLLFDFGPAIIMMLSAIEARPAAA